MAVSHELPVTEPVSLSRSELAALKTFALETAEAAGAAALPYFRSAVHVENKKADEQGYDPVTAADRRAEEIVREAVGARYPQHGLFGEEFGHQPGNGLTWVIDPIDGTRAFVTGMLHWGLLLALFDGQRPVLGVMHQPYTGETWVGDGQSAEFMAPGGDVVGLRSRACASLGDAVLCSTGPQFVTDPAARQRFHALEERVRTVRYGGDCFPYAMVAMGLVDIAVDGPMNAYDIQALMPIIQGAGGVVSTWDGGDAALGGAIVAAGDPALHAQAVAVLSGSSG